MTSDELDTLASRVVEKLGGAVVSSVLPPALAEIIRRDGRGQQWQFTYHLPMGSGGLMVRFDIAADGAITQHFLDLGGQIHWRGTFLV